MAVFSLPGSVDACLRLFKVAHAVVEGIEHHRACRRERNAQTRRRDLSHEHAATIVILESMDLVIPLPDAAADYCIAELFLLQQLFDRVQFRHEPCHDHELFVLCHSGVDDIRKRVQLGVAHGMQRTIVVGEVAARDLG